MVQNSLAGSPPQTKSATAARRQTVALDHSQTPARSGKH
jgi:hypothetical protein